MIRAFLLNLFLAAVYIALADSGVTPVNFAIGFAVGYAALSIYALSVGQRNYGVKVFKLFRFTGYFLYILTKANLQIAWEIITPGFSQTPRILRYAVAGMSEVEITTLASCITLTPGTLVVDVSDDNQWIYVHCMYAKDKNAALADLDELAQRLHQEVFS